MAKVLLVEDDNNLREIYQARLMAEGYDIVAAQNGEEALVVAKQNKPDLIISDVMMPRISGFEMLDILRNTDELKHTRIIMLTALGQAEDQKRADTLGADRYLVKSQVTLEDIVNAAKELLEEDGVTESSSTLSATSQSEPVPQAGTPEVIAVAQEPVVATPTAPVTQSETAQAATLPNSVTTPAAATPLVPVDPATESADPISPLATTSGPVAEPTINSVASPISGTEAGVTADAPAVPAPTAAAAYPSSFGVAPSPVLAPPAAQENSPSAAPGPVSTASNLADQPEMEKPLPTTVAVEPAPGASPATTDATSAVDNAQAQSLQEEEAALQVQIENYATQPDVASVGPDEAQTVVDAENAAVIAEAVEGLNEAVIEKPIQPPSVMNADTVAAEPTSFAPAVQTVAQTSVIQDADKPQSVAGKKVIQPINDLNKKSNLDALVAKEQANDSLPPTVPVVGGSPAANPSTAPVAVSSLPVQPGQSFDPNSAI